MAALADQSTGLVRSFHGSSPTRFERCIGALWAEVNAHGSQIPYLRFRLSDGLMECYLVYFLELTETG